MKKYKIGNRIITADSPVEAIKVSKMLDSSIVKASMKDAWTEVYKQFVEISNKYFPDTNKINQEITKLYSSHRGDSDWDEAHRRWFNIKSKDSANSEIEYLTEEEERAVEDYRKAIAGTTNPKLLELYKHILDEELEHIRELQEADVEDCDMKDERLSPMTYKKLKELGVSNKQWAGWTQEQANEYIRNKSGKKAEKSSEEKKEERDLSKLSDDDVYNELIKKDDYFDEHIQWLEKNDDGTFSFGLDRRPTESDVRRLQKIYPSIAVKFDGYDGIKFKFIH